MSIVCKYYPGKNIRLSIERSDYVLLRHRLRYFLVLGKMIWHFEMSIFQKF